MRRSIILAGRRCVGRPSAAAIASSSSSTSFHSSTVICSSGRGSSPPRRDRVGSDNRHYGRNNVDNTTTTAMRDVIRDGGVGRQGRRLPYENDLHRRKGDPLPPSYIAELTTRVQEHVKDFPDAGFDSNDSNDGAELSQWYVTAVELIMLTSKLWGRGHDHRSEDPRQFVEVVSLANALLDRILTMNKNEIDTILLQQKSLANANNGMCNDVITNQSFHRHHSQKERLSTEILCQTVTLGWSRCEPTIAIDAARNSQTILECLEDICRKRRQWRGDNASVTYNVRDVTPTKYLYNHVLSCWSRSLDPDAKLQARRLLDRMIESKNGITDNSAFSQPDTFSFNNLLNLHASKGDVSAAETLLRHMEDGMADGVQPDVYSYTITMNAFQKRFTSSTYDNRKMNDLERAEDILSRLASQYEKSGFRDIKLRPTNVTFGTVISMYAQFDRMLKQDDRYGHRTRKWKSDQKLANNADESKNVGWGAANAERVLDWMVGLCERERHIKDVMTNSSCMGNESDNVKHGGFNYDTELIRPTAHTFVTVMDAWAKAGKGVEGAEHCQRLLDRLVSLYDKFGCIELRPNPKCFGTVIDAWSKADDRYQTAESAELVLNRMEELFLHSNSGNPKEMLSNVAYNSVIDAWSRRTGTDTAERAEIILRRLVKNYQLTSNRFLMPDVITYTGVIKAYVNRPDGGKKALEILDEMNGQYKDGNNKARPDIQALAVAMDACAKSGLTSEADSILDGIDDSMKSEVLFNTIISGYKKEGRGNEAEFILRKMIRLEKDGYDRCRPDMITYAQVIEAVSIIFQVDYV